MTRQKSERCKGPQARRKSCVTEGIENLRGGKATPVNQQIGQLELSFETAENRAKVRVDGGVAASRLAATLTAAPKSKNKRKNVQSTTMDTVCELLDEAFGNVASNKGAPGPD